VLPRARPSHLVGRRSIDEPADCRDVASTKNKVQVQVRVPEVQERVQVQVLRSQVQVQVQVLLTKHQVQSEYYNTAMGRYHG